MRDLIRFLRAKKDDSQEINDFPSQSARVDESNALSGKIHTHVPPAIVKAIITIATQAWKASVRATNPESKELGPDMKRIQRNLTSIMEALKDIGIEVRDHTGDTFDYGLPLKVVTTQPTTGITKELILETLRPTIYWNNDIVQMGEVIIATPDKTGGTHD